MYPLIISSVDSNLGSVHWFVKDGLDSDGQPVGEDDLGDEEPSTHSPQQPHEVGSEQTGPPQYSGPVPHSAMRGREVNSGKFINLNLHYI